MTQALPLDYGRPPSRQGRRIVIASVLFALFLAGAAWALRPVMAARRAAEARRQAAAAQQQALAMLQATSQLQTDCLNHVDRPDLVVLSTSRADVDASLNTLVDGHWSRENGAADVGSAATAWYRESCAWHRAVELTGTYTSGRPGGTVFLHARHAPGHTDRLVAIEAGCDDIARFSYTVIVPGPKPFAMPIHMRVPTLIKFVHRPNGFRVYAGQPDPADPAAFTIRCVSQDDRPSPDDSIDGRLNADDTVTLTPRRRFIPVSDWERLGPNGQPTTP